MPVETGWFIEGRVTITRLIGDLTIDELIRSAQDGTKQLDSGVAPVYGLVDMTQLKRFPMKISELKQVSDLGTSEKLVWIIIYGIPNPLVSFLATTFSQFIRTHYKVVNTQEDALALVEKLEGKPLVEVKS